MPIFFDARSTAQGLPEPSSLRGSTLHALVPVLSNIKTATGCESNVESCNFELCSQGLLRITINSTVFEDGLGSCYVK